MQFFISLILGALFGYFMVKSAMEKRLFMILTKMQVFSEEQITLITNYYKNYSKIVKEANKLQHDDLLRLENEYRLKNEKNRKL